MIGGWFRRDRSGTKWHLVESIIVNDVITNCGRRMTRDRLFRFTSISRLGTPDVCKQCS